MHQTLPSPGSKWAVHLSIAPNADGELFLLTAAGNPVLRVSAENGRLIAQFTALIDESLKLANIDSMAFTLESPSIPTEASVEWLGYSARLYADGALADEEWPLGVLAWNDLSAQAASGVEYTFADADECVAEQEVSFTGPAQYFIPPGHNTGVGDCMPFSRDGRYCLYYLFDRRGHRSKAKLGAHQWAQISTADLKTWTIHPMAVPIDEQWEGSICTGSLIQKDGVTYAFYAVRMSDKSPAQMSWATSPDGVHFQKSGRTFALTAPYEPVSARDPMVFMDKDGLYHMLVTTSIAEGGRYGGCLAHLSSTNLTEWTQHEPFIVPGYADQPECSDYFFWNGWYYLVFSNFGVARYRMSKAPFGPWIKPAHDVLDSTENQVVKTAAFGERRLMTGFLALYPRTYAGNAITHELFQREDGTLGVKFAEEILPSTGNVQTLPNVLIEDDTARSETTLYEGSIGFRLRATASLDGVGTIAGLTIRNKTAEYRLDFDRDANIVSAMRPDWVFRMGECRLQLTDIALHQPVMIDLIVKGDILDLLVSDGRSMTMRLNESVADGFTLSAYAQTGTLSVKNMTIAALC